MTVVTQTGSRLYRATKAAVSLEFPGSFYRLSITPAGAKLPAEPGGDLFVIDDHLIANHAQRRIQPALRLHVIDKAQFRIGRFALQTVLLPLPPPSGMQRFTVQSWACSPTGSGPSKR